MFAPMLAGITSRSDIEFRVLSDRKPSVPGVLFTWRPWSPESEIAEMEALQIGIMPMPDDEWSRGKCAFKAIQYMAAGVPCVASPVGMTKEVIVNGENGLLAGSIEEWVDALGLLLRDDTMRKALAVEGERTIREKYSLEVHAPRLVSVFEDALAGKS